MSDDTRDDVYNFDLPNDDELAAVAQKLGDADSQGASEHLASIEPGALAGDAGDAGERAVVSSANPKSSANLMIIGVVVAMMACIGGLGFVSYNMFFPSKKAHPAQESFPPVTEQPAATGNDLTAEIPVAAGNDPLQELPADENTVPLASEVQPAEPEVPSSNDLASVASTEAVSQPIEQSAPGISSAVGEGESVREVDGVSVIRTVDGGDVTIAENAQKPTSITEEEEMYDIILRKAESMDVPAEAIKIDQGVIHQKLETKRVDVIESELKNARASVDSIRTAVSDMQGRVADLGKAIDGSQDRQEAIGKQVSELAVIVKDAAQQQAADIEVLRKSVEAAQTKADKALSTSLAATEKAEKSARLDVASNARPVPAQPVAPASTPPAKAAVAVAPQPLPEVKAQPVRPAATNQVGTSFPAPKQVAENHVPVQAYRQPVAQQKVASAQSMTPQCDGRTVSANWRVKGVNDVSAYVVREDRVGLFLRLDVAVPGFGVAVGFDPVGRTVCTTQGLIKR